jgi:CO/xanthine dehydrogenase FAD-binding subunit
MRPAPFDYLAAATVDEACTELGRDPDGTRVLAGGQSLVPLLVRRQERPRRLIDITKIGELHGLYATERDLWVGAAVTQRTAEMSHDINCFGVLAQALPLVGKVTTRNRGTICGSLAYANPAAEIGDTPLLSAAVTARISGDATTQVRIGVGGAGQKPVLAATEITATLAESLDDAAVDHASRAFAAELGFTGDAHVSADHRRRLAIRIVGRLLRRLREDLP